MWQMLFAKVAVGIPYQGGCGLWSNVITISGIWNGHKVTCFTSALVLDCCTEPHPYVGQMVFTYVLVQGWIIDPYV